MLRIIKASPPWPKERGSRDNTGELGWKDQGKRESCWKGTHARLERVCVCVCGTQRPTGKSKGQINEHKGQLMGERGNGVKGSSGGITLTMNINTWCAEYEKKRLRWAWGTRESFLLYRILKAEESEWGKAVRIPGRETTWPEPHKPLTNFKRSFVMWRSRGTNWNWEMISFFLVSLLN